TDTIKARLTLRGGNIMSIINVDEGRYEIRVKTMKQHEDEVSAMADYLAGAAVVNNQEGNLTITLVILDDKTVTGFQILNEAGEEQHALDKQSNKETNRRAELFQLDQLTNPLVARVQYEAEFEGRVFKGDEKLRLVFKEDTLAKID